jgi:hypothetical protein
LTALSIYFKCWQHLQSLLLPQHEARVSCGIAAMSQLRRCRFRHVNGSSCFVWFTMRSGAAGKLQLILCQVMKPMQHCCTMVVIAALAAIP